MVARTIPHTPTQSHTATSDPLAHKRAPTTHKQAKPPERHNIVCIAGLGLVATDQWFALPLELRHRYWTETDYGRQRPSDGLILELEAAAPNGLIIEGRPQPDTANPPF